MAVSNKVMSLLAMGVISAFLLSNCQELAPLFEPSYESRLAEYLSETGAKMYGAYWCPHCARQKQLFGASASLLPYVECDARGPNPQVDLCNAAGIDAYPTWEINGGFYLGTQPLGQLAGLSGFAAPTASGEAESGSLGGFSPAQ
ncbi:MAG: hypothetical protein AAFY17_05710 [Cyanobacteria bacterium J06642_11]